MATYQTLCQHADPSRCRACRYTHHATSLLDVDGILVESSSTVGILVHLTNLQDVVKSIKGNLQYRNMSFDIAKALRVTRTRTWMILLSIDFRRSHKGLITPCWTMYLICEGSAKAPEVAFEMAQQASFLVLKSAFCSRLMRGGMMLLKEIAL